MYNVGHVKQVLKMILCSLGTSDELFTISDILYIKHNINLSSR